MAKLNVLRSFQHNGEVYRCGELPEDATITISKAELKAEMDKGKHKNGRWNSGVLNHCEPADEEARKVLGVEEEEEEEIDEEAEILKLRAEFDKIGKAYDPRWKLVRLTNELKKAKIEVGA